MRDTHVASSVVDVLRVATDGGVHSLVIEKKIPPMALSQRVHVLLVGADPGCMHMRVLGPRFAAAAAALGAALVLLARRRARRPRRVVITGGCGNLGSKLAAHLLRSPEDWSVVLLEHPAFHSDAKVAEGATCVLGDLADGGGAWAAALRGADAVVHFSAVNPYPNASWEESAASMLHTFNVLLLAERAGVRRVVLASSNHVMGGYKEKRSHGLVRPADPPACGTPLRDPVLAASGDAVACFLFSRGVSFVGAPRCVRGRGRLRGRQAHGRATMDVAVFLLSSGFCFSAAFPFRRAALQVACGNAARPAARPVLLHAADRFLPPDAEYLFPCSNRVPTVSNQRSRGHGFRRVQMDPAVH